MNVYKISLDLQLLLEISVLQNFSLAGGQRDLGQEANFCVNFASHSPPGPILTKIKWSCSTLGLLYTNSKLTSFLKPQDCPMTPLWVSEYHVLISCIIYISFGVKMPENTNQPVYVRKKTFSSAKYAFLALQKYVAFTHSTNIYWASTICQPLFQ